MDIYVAESLKVPARVWKAPFRGFLDHDFAAELGRITAPTLVVWGGKDTFSRRSRSAIGCPRPSRARHGFDYPDLGHAMHWEDPAALAADIARFVGRLPAVTATGTPLRICRRYPGAGGRRWRPASRSNRFEHRSTDGTPVILLHGVTDWWRSFEHVLPHLPRSLRAIAVTQRGHGNSTKPATYHYGEMAADIAALLDALQMPSAVIVGHSMGGQVAMRLALDRPSRVRGLVLLASFHTLRGHEVIQQLWGEGIGAMRDPIDRRSSASFRKARWPRRSGGTDECLRRREPEGAGPRVEGHVPRVPRRGLPGRAGRRRRAT